MGFDHTTKQSIVCSNATESKPVKPETSATKILHLWWLLSDSFSHSLLNCQLWQKSFIAMIPDGQAESSLRVSNVVVKSGQAGGVGKLVQIVLDELREHVGHIGVVRIHVCQGGLELKVEARLGTLELVVLDEKLKMVHCCFVSGQQNWQVSFHLTCYKISWFSQGLWHKQLCALFLFIVKMADHDGNHTCLVEKNVPIALILPSRWQDGGESLGMDTTSCLC